jgi:hypothetical protein
MQIQRLGVNSFVQTMRNSFVQQIEPAKDAMRMEEVVKLFSTAFEQNFVNHLSDPTKTNSLAHAVDYPPLFNRRLTKVDMVADQPGFDLKLLRFS